MEKSIHFYEYEPDMPIFHCWKTTKNQLRIGKSTINTMQMGFLHTRLFDLGYRIFIHESENEFYEIVLGCENERTNREIKMGHNLFKMWQSGEFCKRQQIKESKDENENTKEENIKIENIKIEITKNIFHKFNSNYIFDKCIENFHNMTKDHTEILGQFLDFTGINIEQLKECLISGYAYMNMSKFIDR